MAKRPVRANRMGALVLSLGLMIGAGACSPVHTLDLFDPSDGVAITVEGEVKATNLLVLTEAQGSPGTLVGSLSNLTDREVEVELQAEGADPIQVPLAPHHTVYLTPKNPDFDGPTSAFDAQFSSVATMPGGTLEVIIGTASAGAATIEVPVLDGTLEPYDEYLP